MTKWLKIGGLTLILLLIAVRFINLDADPPLFYTGHGQAVLTDPYNLTFFARNAVLYDDANPFDFHRWDIFKNSVVSLVSFILFSLAGVSRVTANIAALLMNLGGMALLLFTIYRKDEPFPTIVAAIMLLVNSTLLFYGRMPFLENGLILLSAAAFAVTVQFHDRPWGQLTAGALVALAGLAGKLFGLILLGPLFFTYLYIYRKQVWRPIIMAAIGFFAGGGLYLLIFYGGDLNLLSNYYSEQSVGMYGKPPGFTSVGNFFKMLLTYGGESGLNEHAPMLLYFGLFSFLIFIIGFDWKEKPKPATVAAIFSLTWLICGVLGLMPFFYRPIRYSIFLYLPLSGIVAYSISLLNDKASLRRALSWPALVAVFVLFYYATTQLSIFFGQAGKKFDAGTEAMAINGVVAFAVTAILFLWSRRKRKSSPVRYVKIALALLGVAVIFFQFPRIYWGLFKSGKNLVQFNKEFAEIIDPASITTGPYMAALNIDNDIKGIIYMFGLSNKQTDLFDRFPISHVVADNSNWSLAMKDYPFLANSTKIAQIMVKDELIGLFRVADAVVPVTEFELGSLAFQAKQMDSAIVHYRKFYETHPDNMLAAMHLVLSYQVIGRAEEMLELAKTIEAKYKENYYAQIFLASYYGSLAMQTKDPAYRTLELEHKAAAKKINPMIKD